MIKKIAFTGISNLVNSKYRSSILLNNENEVPINISNIKFDKISMQLNNKGDSDLDEMSSVLDKFKDSSHLNFLRLSRLNIGTGDVYIVNDKIIEVNSENLGAFSKIQKLLKKIQNNVQSPDLKECYVENDDFYSDISSPDILDDKFHKIFDNFGKKVFSKLPEPLQQNPLELLINLNIQQKIPKKEDCLNLSCSKAAAAELEKSIQKTMERYFA